MNILRSKLFVIAACLATITPSFANDIEQMRAKNKLSLSSSYLSSANSNRAIGEFMIEAVDGYGFIYDELEKALGLEVGVQTYFYDFFFKGGLEFIFGWGPNALLSELTGMTYHEFGHFSRGTAYGLKPTFAGEYTTFFPYFFNYMGGMFSSGDLKESSVNPNGLLNDEQQYFLFIVGGLNNQMQLGELIAEKAYLHGIHTSSVFTYVSQKRAIISYINAFPKQDLDVFEPNKPEKTGNDIMHMIEQYRVLGKDIKTADIKFAANVALIASGSMYSYIWSVYKMFSDRSYKMRPFEIFGVRLPDTSAYYMPQGISYKISSGYRYDDTLVFPVSFEFVQKGDTAYEVTLGVYKEFPEWNELSFRGDIIISDKQEMGGKIYAEFSPFSHAYIGAGVQLYNAKTLYGARNIPSQENGATQSTEWWVQCGVKY